MRRLRLSTLLIAINVGLLLLAVAGVTLVAVNLLQRLADDQALARVEQARTSAQTAIERTGGVVLTDALLLAERPTLRRLLEADDRESLTAFLAQFQQTSQLDGSAVIVDGQVIAQSGAPLAWDKILATPGARPGTGYFLDRPAGNPTLITGAVVEVLSQRGAVVVTVILLDEALSQQIGREIGLTVTILEREAALAGSPQAVLRSRAVVGGEPAAARLDAVGLYVATLPLRAPSGEVVGVVETELPTTNVALSLHNLIETLLFLTLGVAALAAFISFLFGRWLGRPLRALTDAAARIGHGDFSTPIAAQSGGEIGSLAATFEEMRQRLLQLTAHLRREQAESNAIITNVVEGVFTVDRQRRLRYINPQAAAMLGVEPKDAIGRFCGDVLNPQGPDQVRPCEEHCPIVHSRFRAGARAVEHLLLHSGQSRTVIIASAPPDEGQQVQVMRDETEVEATRRLRDAILANISHEFKTPLSAQLASIDLLLDQLPDLTTDQIGELVLSLQRGTLRLTHLIDNLLESVRIEAGEYTIRRRPVSVDEVIEQALELTRPLLQQRGQEVSVELPYPLPTLTGDAPRLTQVFVNLLANASKFSPAGSAIHIGGVVGPEALTVWVEDQGPGLPHPAGQALFTRFMRSPAEEPDQSGVGLGLWIVKSIVERHGGAVDARSSSAGTRMCVTLPVAVSPAPLQRPNGEDSSG